METNSDKMETETNSDKMETETNSDKMETKTNSDKMETETNSDKMEMENLIDKFSKMELLANNENNIDIIPPQTKPLNLQIPISILYKNPKIRYRHR